MMYKVEEPSNSEYCMQFEECFLELEICVLEKGEEVFFQGYPDSIQMALYQQGKWDIQFIWLKHCTFYAFF